MMPFVVGSAVDVRQISVSFKSTARYALVDSCGMANVIENVHIIANLESSQQIAIKLGTTMGSYLSNCLPADVTVKLSTTRLNSQAGGEYFP